VFGRATITLGIGQHSSLSIFFFPSPDLSGRRLDVYHTSTHGMALVRIQNAGLKRAARGSLKIQDAKKVAPSVQRRKVWLTPTTRTPCSKAAKTRNPLKLGGVPQTTGSISAAGGPKFTILWGHVAEILLLNEFFFRLSTVDACHSCKDIVRRRCAMVP